MTAFRSCKARTRERDGERDRKRWRERDRVKGERGERGREEKGGDKGIRRQIDDREKIEREREVRVNRDKRCRGRRQGQGQAERRMRDSAGINRKTERRETHMKSEIVGNGIRRQRGGHSHLPRTSIT